MLYIENPHSTQAPHPALVVGYHGLDEPSREIVVDVLDKGGYARAMTHVLVTPERAAFLRQRLKEKFAEREAAKADFAATCARLATEPRSTFGEFAPSFEEVAPDLGLSISGARSIRDRSGDARAADDVRDRDYCLASCRSESRSITVQLPSV